MPRFRCYHCNAPDSPNFQPPMGFEFEAEGPVCPSCKTAGGMIVPLITMHWHETVPPDQAPAFGMKAAEGMTFSQHTGMFMRIACGLPVSKQWRPGFHATGIVEQVNCPGCMATETYKRARAAMED